MLSHLEARREKSFVDTGSRVLIEHYRPHKFVLQREYTKWSAQRFANQRAKEACVKYPVSYEDTFVINNFFRRWRYKSTHDEKVLCRLLQQVGFIILTRCAFKESKDEELTGLAPESRMPNEFLHLETISIEGTKPINRRTPDNAAKQERPTP